MTEFKVEGYDLVQGSDYREVITSAELIKRVGKIMKEMDSVISDKTIKYNNAIMKGSFLNLYWELQRRWDRIHLDFKEPYVRKIDLLLGRDSNSIAIFEADELIDEDFVGRVKSIRETFIDMANYSILGIILFEESLRLANERVKEIGKGVFQDVS